jgi:hypothetical protein
MRTVPRPAAAPTGRSPSLIFPVEKLPENVNR